MPAAWEDLKIDRERVALTSKLIDVHDIAPALEKEAKDLLVEYLEVQMPGFVRSLGGSRDFLDRVAEVYDDPDLEVKDRLDKMLAYAAVYAALSPKVNTAGDLYDREATKALTSLKMSVKAFDLHAGRTLYQTGDAVVVTDRGSGFVVASGVVSYGR